MFIELFYATTRIAIYDHSLWAMRLLTYLITSIRIRQRDYSS